MTYVSVEFLIFVALTTLVYYLFPCKKYQWTVLLAASYVFYLYNGYRYAIFLIGTTVITYLSALLIERIMHQSKTVLDANKNEWNRTQIKKHKDIAKKKTYSILLGSVIFNLGILVFLKYYNFFAGSLNQLLHAGGTTCSLPVLRLFLPLGISFYTFQSVGYVLDVYHGKVVAERNLAKFALFVSFFPQIIQGPIGFYNRLASQLYEKRRFSFACFKYGCELILWGLFRKLVIADRAYIAINAITKQYSDHNGTILAFLIVLYALQLYADFSGGIDISRGVAQILGIELEQNFRRPYFATNINDYWRRWHITLGMWMKEYVFYPFALSKGISVLCKKIKKSRLGKTAVGKHIAKILPAALASVVVFLLVGIWHGANWKYVAFGLWNGAVVFLSMLFEPIFQLLILKLSINVTSIGYRVFQTIRTLIIVLIGYVFDVAPSFSEAMYTFRMIVSDQNILEGWKSINSLGLKMYDYLILCVCTLVVFCISLIQEKNPKASLRVMLDAKPFIVRFGLIVLAVTTIIIFGIYGPGYDPADFVYMQF